MLQYIEMTYTINPLEFLRQQIDFFDLIHVFLIPCFGMIVASCVSSFLARKAGTVRSWRRALNCSGRLQQAGTMLPYFFDASSRVGPVPLAGALEIVKTYLQKFRLFILKCYR